MSSRQRVPKCGITGRRNHVLVAVPVLARSVMAYMTYAPVGGYEQRIPRGSLVQVQVQCPLPRPRKPYHAVPVSGDQMDLVWDWQVAGGTLDNRWIRSKLGWSVTGLRVVRIPRDIAVNGAYSAASVVVGVVR